MHLYRRIGISIMNNTSKLGIRFIKDDAKVQSAATHGEFDVRCRLHGIVVVHAPVPSRPFDDVVPEPPAARARIIDATGTALLAVPSSAGNLKLQIASAAET